MALWLARAYGEHESNFFEDGRIYLTWQDLTDMDLSPAMYLARRFYLNQDAGLCAKSVVKTLHF